METTNPVVKCAFKELVDPAKLVPHPQNPNHHPPKQIELFISILMYQGCRRPVTVSNRSGFVTKGHGLLESYLQAGWSQVPVDYQDYDSEEEELADIVADNQLARMAEMDNSKLQTVLEKLDSGAFNMELTGFDNVKLEKIFTGFGSKMNEPVFSGGEGAPEGDSSEPNLPPANEGADEHQPSHVRMVQLFLNESTQEEFMKIVEHFQSVLQTDNVTDTVMEVMRNAYVSHTEQQISEHEA